MSGRDVGLAGVPRRGEGGRRCLFPVVPDVTCEGCPRKVPQTDTAHTSVRSPGGWKSVMWVSAGLGPPDAGEDGPIPRWCLACKVVLSLRICPRLDLLSLQGHLSY